MLFSLITSAFAGGMGFTGSALAQAGSTTPNVPQSAWYAGLGGSYNWINFGTQDVYAVGTSNFYSADGTLQSSGSAAGPGTVNMSSESTFARSAQWGYFQKFSGSNWLWGVKFAYNHLAATSTEMDVRIPQTGSFTNVQTGATTQFTGTAFARSFQTNIEQQIALTPFIGSSYEKGFVYIGAGPTYSQTRTNVNGLVGLANISGNVIDVSGAPVDFASSSWVWGGAALVGATYFFTPSWFLDFSYAYARTNNHTRDFSSPFANLHGPEDSTITGTLAGSSSGKVITQGLMLTINLAF
jgi:hypothetical protein